MPVVSRSRRVALVTGAGRGLGQASALRLAADGLAVGVNFRGSKRGAEETVAAIRASGGRAVAVKADVTHPAEVERMFGAVERALGPVAVLVNNAGIYPRKALEKITPRDFDHVLSTNLRSQFLCARRAIPSMRRKKWGRVIN
ncbi:MAG: SDR family NAD(P)-dependent oxidoreductase, partial [Methanobacteriota archaeon]